MAFFTRFVRALPLLVLSPFLIFISALSLLVTDLLFRLAGRTRQPANTLPNNQSASVVIPNWNGRDLLETYLPSVIQAVDGHPDNEVIVVDNGSSDGSADFVRSRFPRVRVLALPTNLGFGGGSNAGIETAKNDIVVLLNSDMRVEPRFLPPLLSAFTDPKVFAVSAQIFFSDPSKVREETGLTQASWDAGGLRVRHRLDDTIDRPFPCFYGGGGSTAFDRRKFLELGGFDRLLAPFYLEDTDLGYLAWKRGWKVLYQPASTVYHEHRGTIGRKFSQEYIQNVIRQNFLLFAWKNIHESKRIVSHLIYALVGTWISLLLGDSLERANLVSLGKAFLRLPIACRSRWQARTLARITDTEAFRRPLGGYFLDRFHKLPAVPDRVRVLFVSPYTILPPVHGGAVFMSQTCRVLAELAELHLLVLIDKPEEQPPHDELVRRCASADFIVRPEGQVHTFGSILPHAIHEFQLPDIEWVIHRQIFLRQIDVVQLDYLPMAQYRCDFRQIPQILFEHDLYFQSIGRQLVSMGSLLKRAMASFEYLRAIRYELQILPEFDRIQLCSKANRDFLLPFAPDLEPQLDDNLRAGIDTAAYPFKPRGRQPFTMLFLGSFRHVPNAEALHWLVHRSFPLVLEACPRAKLIVIGSDPPPRYSLPDFGESIELRGYVDDILQPLSECAVFLCPILSGSGVRVKLLEAFACGIPVISTTVGAEGLAERDGEFCLLADDPRLFAEKVVRLLNHPEEAELLARRARAEVETNWDMPLLTRRLVESYRRVIKQKRS